MAKPSKIGADLRFRIDAFIEAAQLAAATPPPPLDEYLQSLSGSSFHDLLWDFIGKDGRSEVEIYEQAGISRAKFSRIRSNRDYKPDKLTAVSLVFALRLDLESAEKLLRSASIALSAASKFDLIIRYFLEAGDTDYFHVNDALFTYNEPLICGVVAE